MLKYIIFLFLTLLSLSAPAKADDVDIPHTFTDGTPAVAAQVNENFEALKAAIDLLSAQRNLDSLGITPIGGIVAFYRDAADIPDNWILCDGRQVLDPESPLHLSDTPNMVSRVARGVSAASSLGSGGSDFHGHSLSIARDSVISPRQVFSNVGIPNSGPAGVSGRYYPLSWDSDESGTVYESHGHVGSAVTVAHVPAHVRVRFIMRIK